MPQSQNLSSELELECLRFQQDQFEILSYIYLDEFHIVKELAPHKFSINIKPYIQKFRFDYELSVHFEFTKTYPKTALKYDIEPITGITRDNLNFITKRIEDLIYQNRGKPIVYDIIEETRLWITEYLIEGKTYEPEVEIIQKAKEVFERPKFAAFTPVTIESFLAWKKEFDFKHQKLVVKKEGEIKITGKQYFLGIKEDEIEEQDSDQEDQEDEEEEEEDTRPKNFDDPENKLFMMDEEETNQVQ